MKVSIRKLTIEDANISFLWRKDKEVFQYTDQMNGEDITIEDERQWIKISLEDRNAVYFAIIANNLYVGNIFITDINTKTPYFHIYIGEKTLWNKQIGYKSSSCLMDYAFNTLHLKRLYLYVHKKNIYAKKLYKKLGFYFDSPYDETWDRLVLENKSLTY